MNDDFPGTTASAGLASLKPRRGLLFIALAGLFIAISTLFPDVGAPPRPFEFCLSCGTFGGANLLLNALLFLPLGAALRRYGLSLALSIGISLAATTAVEMLQLFLVAGRFSALADIVANTAGGAGGWLLAAAWPWLSRPNRRQGLILGSVHAACMIALVAFGWWIFQAAPTEQAYFGQIAPVVREQGAVDGIVTDVGLNGGRFPDGRMSPADAEAIRGQMRENRLSLRSRLALRNEKGRLVLVVRIADDLGEEIGAIGLHGKDAVLAVRTRAADFALFQPMLVLPGAFSCDSCRDGLRRDPVDVAGARDGVKYELSASDGEGARTSSMVLSGNLTWLAFFPEPGIAVNSMHVITSLWIAGQALLLGFWLARSATGARAAVAVLIGTVIVGSISQLLLPQLLGMPLGSQAEWMALVTGALAGAVIAVLTRPAAAEA